ncbi:MAG: ArsA family ATPase [Acidimicrobiia bacterium]
MTATTLVADRHVLICCGTGGVGKTTTAAALALEGARRGRNTVVVTIDPARRLADALGLELADTPTEIPRASWDPSDTAASAGRMSALMLDAKGTFDRLVRRYASDEEQAERILANRFYRNVSSALSGTQEYMAMEQLHELHEAGGYDLIVVDTPPTRRALDFLDAPRRLARLLDNRLFRVVVTPGRAGLRLVSAGLQRFLRVVAKVVGAEVINDVIAFFRAFEGMEEGFRARAGEVLELLADPTTAFVLITSPRRDAVEEAEFFATRLAEGDVAVSALVVNRVHPRFGPWPAADLRAKAARLRAEDNGDNRARLAAAYDNLADAQQLADLERVHLAGIEGRLSAADIVHVPWLTREVHDFDALTEVGSYLVR